MYPANVKTAFLTVGALLIVIGALGFVQDPILGILYVGPLQNLIYVGAGIAAIGAAMSGIGTMRLCGRMLGIAFGGLAIAGFATGGLFGLATLTQAANYLHVAVSLLFLYYALLAPPV